MAKNKTFTIQVQRVYKADFEYEAKSIDEIENMINWNLREDEMYSVTPDMCADLWDTLGERELEQMDVDTIDYKIYEKGNETDPYYEHPWKRIS
jgi:hypothetical protein